MNSTADTIWIVSEDVGFFSNTFSIISRSAGSSPVKRLSYEQAVGLLSAEVPKLIFFDIAAQKSLVLGLTDAGSRVPHPAHACRWVGVGQPTDTSLVMTLVRSGVTDFIPDPTDPGEIKAVLQKMSAAESAAAPAASHRAKIVTVYSPKGGSGVTLITTNIARSLCRDASSKVIVCDLSSQCGDAATYLNMSARYTIRDVVDSQSEIDASFLDGVLLTHASGVRVLAGPRPDQLPLTADHLRSLKTVLDLLRDRFDYILIDSGTLEPALLQFVMTESDAVLLLANPDVVSIKGLVAAYLKLKAMHYDPQRVKVAINRCQSKGQIDVKEFEKLTRHPIHYFLPNNYSVCIDAVNTGEPLPERSELAKKLAEIAHDLRAGGSVASAVNSSKGFLKGGLKCFL